MQKCKKKKKNNFRPISNAEQFDFNFLSTQKNKLY